VFEVRARQFVPDSALEEEGFEPPVPLAKRVGLSGGTGSAAEAKRAVWKSSSILRGTEGSNLLPSSGESGANLWIDRETGLPLHERAGVLRHFADIRIIPVLLGHGRLATTAIYTRVATNVIAGTPSPLDRLHLSVTPPS